MLRNCIAIGLAVLAAGFLFYWVMGDEVGPFVTTAKQSLRDQFVGMVDKYELELKKAEAEVAKAEERAVQLRMQKHKAAAGVTTLQREMQVVQNEVQDAQTQLALLRDNLEAGRQVRLVSGRLATDSELKSIVDDQATRIQIAQEKLSYLEQFMQRRKSRHDKLIQLDKQSPAALQRLRNSVGMLARKLEMYRDVREWVEQDEAAEVALTGLYDKAQRTLEDAHAQLDTKLAEIDAMLDMSLELEVDPVKEPHSTDELLADIRTALAGGVGIER